MPKCLNKQNERQETLKFKLQINEPEKAKD